MAKGNSMKNIFMAEVTLQIFNDFKETLKNDRSKTEYFYILNSFCAFCGKDYLNASYEDFKNYFDSLNTSASLGDISFKTICTRYAVMINFSSYIVAHAATYNISNFMNYMVKVQKPGVSINIKSKSMPDLKQLNEIYTAAKEDPMMYAIIALVNKCALTTEQICKLKLANFIIDSEMNCGILFPYQYSADKYIKLPDDIRDIINQYVNTYRNTSTDYLFCNAKGGPLTHRVLQNKMKTIVKKASGEEEWTFTLQDIRNLSVVLMLKGGAEAKDVSEYIGVNSKWMQKYDRAVEAFSYGPCDYINIKISCQ